MNVLYIFLFYSAYCANTTCNLHSLDFVCKVGYGCVDGFCAKCFNDSHCSAQAECVNGECVHRGIFPLTWQTILSGIGVFFVSVLGGATGLGGGSFIVPVLALCSMFTPTEAVALSQVYYLYI